MKIVRQKLELKKCKHRHRKWADVNHVKRTLGKTLHDSKGLDSGLGNDRLTDQVKEYVLYCFSIALSQNKGNVLGLQRTIRSVVPQAFRNHELCRYKKDPKSFSHKNSLGGKYLIGSGLQTFLTETLKRYACDNVAQKVAPLGSTQRNKCLNSIIASKNLKIRFYGGSESSDYRTAAATAHFKEGHSYLSMVMDKLNHQSNPHSLTKHIVKYNMKQHDKQ